MIIAAFAGAGKTTLAKMYPHIFEDFVCMPYKYDLLWEDFDQLESEAYKVNFDLTMREDWPNYYFDAIKKAMNNSKHLIIPSDSRVLRMLAGENIPYKLFYPQREAKEIYRKRYIERGNTEDFLSVFIGCWEHFMDSLEADTYGERTIMKPEQFLSDFLYKSLT